MNAGCRITSIQKLLGHKRLNSTMVYARVYNRTVAEDYYAAMAKIEKRLDPSIPSAGQAPNAEHGQDPVTRVDNASEPVSTSERTQLLTLIDRLAEPQLGLEARLLLVEQMRRVLNHAENLTPASVP